MSELTVRDLLPTHFKNLDTVVRDDLAQSPELRAARYPKSLDGYVANHAADAVSRVLDIDVFDCLARAWAAASELHEYSTRAGKHPATETNTLFLGKHSLDVELHPIVELAFGAIYRTSLRFTLKLSADLNFADLVIRDGHIMEIGRCEGVASAQLLYGEVALHGPLKSKPLPFVRGRHLPPPGFQIP